MAEDTEVHIDVLEDRLDALKTLSVELLGGQRAVTALELDKILGSIDSQESLCDEVRSFEQELENLHERIRECSDALPGDSFHGSELNALLSLFEPHAQEKAQRLLGELKKSQDGIRRVNQIHTELLRESRRSVNALINLTRHFRGTDARSLVHAPEYAGASPRK